VPGGTAPSITTQPRGLLVNPGNDANFSVSAIGTPPFQYQWRFNEVDLAGATSVSLVVTNVHAAQTGDYSVVVSNDYGSVTSTVAVLSVTLELADALDTPGWSWSTGGNAQWFGQTNVTHDGVDAARCGPLDYFGDAGYLETVVVGPGRLSFWWKVSTWYSQNALSFLINGSVQDVVAGEVDWQQRVYWLRPGTNTLRWVGSRGVSAGFFEPAYLDEVSWVPALQLTAGLTNGSFCLQIGNMNARPVDPERLPGIDVYATTNLPLNMSNWVRLTNNLVLTNGVLLLADPESALFRQRFYRVLERP
jgi:hypothetical protein